MRRIYQRLVRKSQQFVVQRIVKARAEVVGRPPQRCPQVRTAHITNEERVTREHRVRMNRVLREIEDQDRDGFDGVPRRLEHL